MELTPAQRSLLELYREAKIRPRPLLGQLKSVLSRVLILAALVTVLAFTAPGWLTCMVGGFAAGGVTRHVAMLVQSRRLLPLLLDIIDWPRVDRLLDGAEELEPPHVS